jgi:hypothetical protein
VYLEGENGTQKVQTDCYSMLKLGKELAARAGCARGEFNAWDSAVAQHMDVLRDDWKRPEKWLSELLRRKREARAILISQGRQAAKALGS